MTDAETLDAARDIVAAIGTGNWLRVQEGSKYRLPELAKLLLAHDAALAEARAENERLNSMRVHCSDCGGDYLRTGVETGCPCNLKAELAEAKAALREQVRHCGLCFGKGYVSVGVFGQWVKNDCPDCKHARDLIAEHEGRP